MYLAHNLSVKFISTYLMLYIWCIHEAKMFLPSHTVYYLPSIDKKLKIPTCCNSHYKTN